MRLPIPDDWNGQDWTCIKVQWPNSPIWTAILLGLLEIPMRGYSWDERTGTITDVQAIGREILARAFPFVPCDDNSDDCTGNPSLPDVVAYGAMCDIGDECLECGDENNMTCCLRWNNGVLEMYSCGEWSPIPGAAITPDEPVVVLPPDIDTNETGIYPCGKASHLAAELVKFADYAWDESDNQLPIIFIWNMQNYMNYDFKNAWTDQVQSQALIMKSVIIATSGLISVSKIEAIPPNLAQELACRLLPAMTNTTTDDKEQIWSTLINAIDAIFPPFSLANASTVNNWWRTIAAAFGKQLLHDIAQAGAYTDADCSCPGSDIIEASSIFFTTIDQSHVVNTGTAVQLAEVHDGGRRAKFRVAAAAGDWRSCADLRVNIAGAQAGDDITVRMIYDSGHPIPGWQWYNDACPNDVDRWPTCDFLGHTNDAATRENLATYVEWTSNAEPTHIMNQFQIELMRFCPQLQVGNVNSTFWVEIVAVNGVRLNPITPVG